MGATVRFAGVAAASVAGAVAGVVAVRRFRGLRARLFDLEVDAETAAVRARLREAETRRQRHAVANAVTAVEGAALIFERDTLGAADREALRRVLGSGLDRLRRLSLDDGMADGRHVSLFHVGSRLAEDRRWSDSVRVDVPAEAVAVGAAEEIMEAASQLLSHVSRRGPGPFAVRGARDDDAWVLWIEAPAGWNAPGRGSDDLALQVASRLVRGQGGDLRVEKRLDGGRSFGICLPAAEAPSAQ